MSRTNVSDLEPGSRAVLSLLLQQGRTYDDIGAVLKLDPADVCARAHGAAAVLADDGDSALDPAARAMITDYLLGQQQHAERVRTCDALAASQSGRKWAIRLARALAPLSKTPLPVIPGPDRRVRRRQAAAGGAVLVVAAVVAAVVLATSGGGNPTVATLARIPSPKGVRGRTVQRFVMLPSTADRHAFGAGAVLSQGSNMLLLLQGRGLDANRHDSYGVWLFNAPGDAQLLGFISPPVGKSGTFSSGTTLPDDAVRFHSLIVTNETKPSPTTPGAVVMRAKLSFS